MAKGQDPFDKFRTVTLSGNTLIKDALSPDMHASKVAETTVNSSVTVKPTHPEKAAPSPSFPRKNKKDEAELEQVSFFIDKSLKKAMALLKYETEIPLRELYEEAINDLLIKYNKH